MEKPSRTVIALLQARGRGSTLPNKNLYPLNGEPMLRHFLREMKRAAFIDHIGVWTESTEVAQVVEACGCVFLERPKKMVHYGAGYYTTQEWNQYFDSQVHERFGTDDYIRVWLNCNHVLFTADSLTAMYTLLMADDDADIVFPIYEIDADLCLVNENTGYLFPFLGRATTGAQPPPSLYRRVGMHISFTRSVKDPFAMKTRYHVIPWHEGLDVQCEDDVPLAEYYLAKRCRPAG